MQFNSKGKIIALMMAIAMAAMPFTAWSAEDGDGDGSGGGKSQPLTLLSSSPADGAVGVPVDAQIKLSFNKNVVNISVKDNNRSCFTLAAGQKAVAFDVVMADDQMQPEGKRDIILKPRNSMQAGTRYTVDISSRLIAKNGSTLPQTVSLSFTTSGPAPADKIQPGQDAGKTTAKTDNPQMDKTAAPPPDMLQVPAADTDSTVVVTEPAVAEPDSAAAVESRDNEADASAAAEKSSVASSQDNTGLYVFGTIIIVVVGVMAWYMKKRRN